MYCSKCGKENDDHSLFCGQCGEKLQNASFVKSVIQKTFQRILPVMEKAFIFCEEKAVIFKQLSPKKSALCAVALVLVVIVCFTFFYKSDEEKIIELTNTLAASMNEGDYEKMISCFEPAAQNQMNALLDVGSSLLSSVDLKALWSLGSLEMSEYYEDIYISIHSITVEHDTASADISFSFDEGKDDAIGTVELIKIKGKWYFRNF